MEEMGNERKPRNVRQHLDFMTPKIMKRGRPKVAELTVVGIPKTKKRKMEGSILLPYNKLKPYDKERMILECVTKKRIVVAEALNGKRLLDNDNIQTNIHLIPDAVRDRDNTDIFRVEKFFSEDSWFQLLEILQKKEETAWHCKACSKAIKDNQESIACDHCLSWYHFLCSSLSTKPKARNWFCKNCKTKLNLNLFTPVLGTGRRIPASSLIFQILNV